MGPADLVRRLKQNFVVSNVEMLMQQRDPKATQHAVLLKDLVKLLEQGLFVEFSGIEHWQA